ncbi:Predicted dehydrogenase [Flavobacterium sp. CF108]|uniref:Gfo/Idh/MocA family protein n=1 Tax=unclassified Flavobacterium TaxID=196869 RepID=UPI0008D87BE0|nr:MULTISPECIES: Gfo/Idh/MocA family oxidoreductase [unclassified Flavobacterium]SEO92844.1 Predicted dehydrogenase [Flavobacterium sp. fv08]SHH84013.1 Predicted dehydrogenase [Flavobacterium sp. CF108]
MKNQKIKWGIIGLGNIAHQFATDLLLIEEAELLAVASRDILKADEFATKYNAAKAYDSYEALFADQEVDIVYIATPHDSHAELSIKAIESGKHVLCEKPIALSYKDAERMIEASKKHNKFFMEAFWTRFIPAVQEVLAKIESGIIGEANYIKADFAFIGNDVEGSRLFDKNRGGGSLFDIGVYPLFLSYIVFGIPKEIIAKAVYHKNGIDLQASMILQYEKAQSILNSSIVSESDMKALISGTQGRIELNSPWFVADGYSVFNGEQESVYSLPTIGKGYAHEILECNDCILNNQIESKLWSHQNSLDLSKIVEEIKTQIGLNFF